MPGIAPKSKGIKKSEKSSKKLSEEPQVKNVDFFEKFPISVVVNFSQLCVRFYLLPELDIFTMDFKTELENPFFTIDMLFGGLFQNSQAGGLIQISETEYLTQNSNERCFKWIHTLAGVNFDNI